MQSSRQPVYNTFLIGLAMISCMSKSKKLPVLADLMIMAVLAPLCWPATAITFSPIGMAPASAAIRVISGQTFMPDEKMRSTFAMRSPDGGTYGGQ